MSDSSRRDFLKSVSASGLALSAADAAFAGELGNWRQGGKADPAAEDYDVLPGAIDREADAQRPNHVEFIPRLKRRQSKRSAADALIEKLDAAIFAVDAINALRTAQPEFGGIRRRTQ